jgi:hypothetical protein
MKQKLNIFLLSILLFVSIPCFSGVNACTYTITSQFVDCELTETWTWPSDSNGNCCSAQTGSALYEGTLNCPEGRFDFGGGYNSISNVQSVAC